MFVTIVIVIICASLAYLIIYGSSKNKSDEEQSKYLKEYKNKNSKWWRLLNGKWNI